MKHICNMPACWLVNIILVFILFVGIFLSHSRIFHSYGDVTNAGEWLQILIYARHSWSLSSEGSLACHTYCDTGHSFIMVISEDPWHSHLLPSVKQWSCHYLCLRLRSVSRDLNTQPSACEANALTHCATAGVYNIKAINIYFCNSYILDIFLLNCFKPGFASKLFRVCILNKVKYLKYLVCEQVSFWTKWNESSE